MLRRAAALAALLLGCGDAAGIGDARRRDTDTTRHGDAGDEVQSMLGALLESMSFAISQLYADRYDFLRTRAWYGNSHIGNRPIQARAYYDLARSVQPGTICEVGFNGGHSAAVFLSAAGRRAKMVSLIWPSSSTPRRRSSSSGPSTRTSSG